MIPNTRYFTWKCQSLEVKIKKFSIFISINTHTHNIILTQNFYFPVSIADFNSQRYTSMLRNVISSFTLKVFGALKLISWKYTYKRLNEEYEIANKKKQALNKLFENGKISQSTHDSFTNDINAAIVQIEKQQKELIENMQLKTQELENQIKTLETLLANYEIQHVVGEIDEQIYQQEINLITNGLDTARNELNVIKQSADQLCSPTSIQAPAAPEPVAPIIEAKVSEPAPVEPTSVEVPVEAAQVETVTETSSVPIAPAETAPAEIPLETIKAEAAPVESAPIEAAPVESTPIETAPVENTPVETASAPIETAPVENTPVETVPAPIETAPVENTPVETVPAPIETAPVENTPVEAAPVEVAPVETPTVEVIPEETPTIAPPEPEIQVIKEPEPEIAPQEPAITEPAPQEPAINTEAVTPIEQPAVAETANVTPNEVIVEAEPEQPAKVALQDFEVIPETAAVETTLEKVLVPANEPVVEPVVEEATVPAHPLEAPQGAQTAAEQSSEEAAAAAETEDSNEEETE